MMYSRFFKSLKPPLYVGLEVDTQQLNVPKFNAAYKYTCVNRTNKNRHMDRKKCREFVAKYQKNRKKIILNLKKTELLKIKKH